MKISQQHIPGNKQRPILFSPTSAPLAPPRAWNLLSPKLSSKLARVHVKYSLTAQFYENIQTKQQEQQAKSLCAQVSGSKTMLQKGSAASCCSRLFQGPPRLVFLYFVVTCLQLEEHSFIGKAWVCVIQELCGGRAESKFLSLLCRLPDGQQLQDDFSSATLNLQDKKFSLLWRELIFRNIHCLTRKQFNVF